MLLSTIDTLGDDLGSSLPQEPDDDVELINRAIGGGRSAHRATTPPHAFRFGGSSPTESDEHYDPFAAMMDVDAPHGPIRRSPSTDPRPTSGRRGGTRVKHTTDLGRPQRVGGAPLQTRDAHGRARRLQTTANTGGESDRAIHGCRSKAAVSNIHRMMRHEPGEQINVRVMNVDVVGYIAISSISPIRKRNYRTQQSGPRRLYPAYQSVARPPRTVPLLFPPTHHGPSR